jgi:hypothetical protein
VARLESRALNRAALARQYLLERADVDALDAVTHLGGLQAQEPQEPYTGMWSRVAGFDPHAFSDLLARRRVVRTHLMRRTVHLVTAEDAVAWRTRHDAMLIQRLLGCTAASSRASTGGAGRRRRGGPGHRTAHAP